MSNRIVSLPEGPHTGSFFFKQIICRLLVNAVCKLRPDVSGGNNCIEMSAYENWYSKDVLNTNYVGKYNGLKRIAGMWININFDVSYDKVGVKERTY